MTVAIKQVEDICAAFRVLDKTYDAIERHVQQAHAELAAAMAALGCAPDPDTDDERDAEIHRACDLWVQIKQVEHTCLLFSHRTSVRAGNVGAKPIKDRG